MSGEPRWLAKSEVVELHDYVLERTGGASGLRDHGPLESALNRPINKWGYEGIKDKCGPAAAYSFDLVKTIRSLMETSDPRSWLLACFST